MVKKFRNLRHYFLCKAVFCGVIFKDEMTAQAKSGNVVYSPASLFQINF